MKSFCTYKSCLDKTCDSDAPVDFCLRGEPLILLWQKLFWENWRNNGEEALIDCRCCNDLICMWRECFEVEMIGQTNRPRRSAWAELHIHTVDACQLQNIAECVKDCDPYTSLTCCDVATVVIRKWWDQWQVSFNSLPRIRNSEARWTQSPFTFTATLVVFYSSTSPLRMLSNEGQESTTCISLTIWHDTRSNTSSVVIENEPITYVWFTTS